MMKLYIEESDFNKIKRISNGENELALICMWISPSIHHPFEIKISAARRVLKTPLSVRLKHLYNSIIAAIKKAYRG